MAEKKPKCIYLYYEWENALSAIDDAEFGALVRALWRYGRGDNTANENLSSTAKLAFSFMAPQIDRDKEKYRKICERNNNNSKNAGRRPKNPVGL